VKAARAKMPISPTESAPGGGVCIVFADGAGAPGRWLRFDGAGTIERGDSGGGIPPAARIVLAVPGEEVAVHWRALDEGLSPAQAAAAARLILADSSAEPLGEMHVAVGRPEAGLTPIALVPAARVAGWMADAAAAGIDPDALVPTPLLLPVPEAGFVRRDRGTIADYRGPGAAFSLEPDLAAAITADAPAEALDEPAFEAGVGAIAAAPPLDLRQGPFAKRPAWRGDSRQLRRLAVFAMLFALLSLVVQGAAILSYTFAADKAQAEADALARDGANGGPGFAAAAALLFEAVRATPNAEVARLDYRSDGTLVATVTTDSPATLAGLQALIEAGGLRVAPGTPSQAGGRSATELRIRAG